MLLKPLKSKCRRSHLTKMEWFAHRAIAKQGMVIRMNIIAHIVDRQLIGVMTNDIPNSILLCFCSVLNSRNCEGVG